MLIGTILFTRILLDNLLYPGMVVEHDGVIFLHLLHPVLCQALWLTGISNSCFMYRNIKGRIQEYSNIKNKILLKFVKSIIMIEL